MTKCPHCTQGYVQDAGFAICNHCQGTGKIPSDAAACSTDDLRVRDADAVEVFIADYTGKRYSGSNFADIESARAWLTLQPNRDSLRVAITAKFLLENVQAVAPATLDSASPDDVMAG